MSIATSVKALMDCTHRVFCGLENREREALKKKPFSIEKRVFSELVSQISLFVLRKVEEE